MDAVTLLGLFAGICTTSAVVPQLIRAWKTKKVKDVSPIMFAILLLGVGLWVVYGVLKDDLAIIVTNGFSLVLNMSMLYLMLRYSGKK
ncbi:SemiSWEET transporter [uncultured Marixanthomonas sp.]|uniref:SemiSWEET family sugar transporter n=1 Tax=uncultured Marixanthomonas sp. TaxID=757245 RepID=UPI0030D6DF6F|tara:strand:- start:209 stop:472 length:264 start_codon:yes stop_codon:yes gene_type:complete